MRMLLFADIHIGSIKDVSYVYNVITDIIEKEVVFKKTDVVVILGDYFHRLFKVNEEYVSLAINVMSYLIRACVKNNTKIRIVYGTESHEMNQYRLFNYHITSSDVDLKIFDTVTEETIHGHNILYIPEEYISDKHQHYKSYLYSDKYYDYIFGHGIIEDGMPSIVSQSNESNKNDEKQVPRFKSGELAAVSDVCVFGHFHIHTKMEGEVYYLGSLFRSSFGEEEPKGYGIIEGNKFTFIENTKAYVYKTYEYGPTSNIYSSAEGIMDEIAKIKKENDSLFSGETGGKIRLLFKAPNDMDPSFKENLQSLIFNDDRISSLIKEQNTELVDEIKEDLEDEFDFIIDPSLGIIDKIYRYICMQYEEPPFSIDKLTEYIGKSVDRFNKPYEQLYGEYKNIIDDLGLRQVVTKAVDEAMNTLATE